MTMNAAPEERPRLQLASRECAQRQNGVFHTPRPRMTTADAETPPEATARREHGPRHDPNPIRQCPCVQCECIRPLRELHP